MDVYAIYLAKSCSYHRSLKHCGDDLYIRTGYETPRRDSQKSHNPLIFSKLDQFFQEKVNQGYSRREFIKDGALTVGAASALSICGLAPAQAAGKSKGLVETGETFSGMNLDWDVPKPFFDRGDQGCGIISVNIRYVFKPVLPSLVKKPLFE
jgi:hypothetical protein